MSKIVEKISAFVKDEEGLTMVEYAIAGALVTAGCVVAFQALGAAVSGRITTLAGIVANS